MNATPKRNSIFYARNQESSAWKKDLHHGNTYKPPLQRSTVEKKCVKQSITRQQWISEAAYYKAEAREFTAGQELNDWLEAEKDFIEMVITTYLSVFEEDGGITKANLQQLAKAIGVETPEGFSNKNQLIRAIQKERGQRPCFRSESNILCDDEDCIWKTECQKLIAVWMR
jgi:DUF2934 family protein